MVQESEIVSLLLAIALTPIIYSSLRRIEFIGKPEMIAGLGFVLCSYMFTVLESWYWPDALNMVEHFALAAAGVSFAVGTVKIAYASRRWRA